VLGVSDPCYFSQRASLAAGLMIGFCISSSRLNEPETKPRKGTVFIDYFLVGVVQKVALSLDRERIEIVASGFLFRPFPCVPDD
jgi:hypothetical protein